jgi:hypothetical protein
MSMDAAGRLIACLALALCLAPAPGRAEGDPELLRRLMSSVLKVEAHNGDGSVSIGSAVVVAPGIAATNCHVTRNARDITLVRGALRYRVDTQHSEIEHDLCLLASRDAGEEAVVALIPAPPRPGQAVYAVGFILGVAARINAGTVQAVHGYDEGKVIETDAAFTSGASGGGLFAPDGALLGIVSFRGRAAAPRFFCLPAVWVREALARFDGRPVAPLTGTAFWQRPEAEQPYFLRAASLEAGGAWQDLARLAREWSFAEADNATSWFVLGKAEARLHRSEEAIAAYRVALGIEPDFAQAWYCLGRAYLEGGEDAAVRDVQALLRPLDPGLAQALAQPATPDRPAALRPC